MQEIFTALSHAIEGSPWIAAGSAILWGVLSVILSPCHLASIPLIVAFINGQRALTGRRALSLALLFAVGILVTIAIIGVITAAAGRLLGDLGHGANYFVAVIFLLVGLHLLGVIPMPGPGGAAGAGLRRRGRLAAFFLGLVFGLALGPCTFAYMAPLLAVTFRLAATQPLYSIALLLCYAVGHCAVIVFAGTSTELVQRYLNWNERSRGTVIVRRVCGAFVLLGGIYMIYAA